MMTRIDALSMSAAVSAGLGLSYGKLTGTSTSMPIYAYYQYR